MLFSQNSAPKFSSNCDVFSRKVILYYNPIFSWPSQFTMEEKLITHSHGNYSEIHRFQPGSRLRVLLRLFIYLFTCLCKDYHEGRREPQASDEHQDWPGARSFQTKPQWPQPASTDWPNRKGRWLVLIVPKKCVHMRPLAFPRFFQDGGRSRAAPPPRCNFSFKGQSGLALVPGGRLTAVSQTPWTAAWRIFNYTPHKPAWRRYVRQCGEYFLGY